MNENGTAVDASTQELMERIRKAFGTPTNGAAHAEVSSAPPPQPPPPPTFSLPVTVAPVPLAVHLQPKVFDSTKARHLVSEARESTAVRRSIPKFLRGLFRKQGGFNRAIIDLVNLLTKSNARVQNQLNQLVAHVEVQTRWLEELAAARNKDAAETVEIRKWMEVTSTSIEAATNRVARTEDLYAHADQRQAGFESRLEQVAGRVAGHGERFAAFEQDAAKTARRIVELDEAWVATYKRLDTHLATLDKRADAREQHGAEIDRRVANVGHGIDAAHRRLGEVDDRLSDTDERVKDLYEHVTASQDRTDRLDEHVGRADQRLDHIEQRDGVLERRIADLADGISSSQQRVDAHLGHLDQRADAREKHGREIDERDAVVARELEETSRRVARLDERATAFHERADRLDEHAGRTDQRVDAIEAHDGAADRRIAELGDNLAATQQRVDGRLAHLDQRADAREQHSREVDERDAVVARELTDARADLTRVAEHAGRTDQRIDAIEAHDGAADRRIAELGDSLAATQQRVDGRLAHLDQRADAREQHSREVDERDVVVARELSGTRADLTRLAEHAGRTDQRVDALEAHHGDSDRRIAELSDGLASTNQRVDGRLAHLDQRADAREQHSREVDERDAVVARELADARDHLTRLDHRSDATERHSAEADDRDAILARELDDAGRRLLSLEERSDATEQHSREADDRDAILGRELDDVGQHLGRLDLRADAVEQHGREVDAREAAVAQDLDVARAHLTRLDERADAVEQHGRDVDERTASLGAIVAELRDQLSNAAQQLTALRALGTDHERRLTEVGAAASEAIQARFAQLAADLIRLSEGAAAASDHLQRLQSHVTVRDAQADAALQQLETDLAHVRDSIRAELEHTREAIEVIRASSSRMDQRQSADAAYVKSQLSVYAQLIHSAVNSLPKSRNGDSKIEAVTRDIDSKALDPFYLAFEDAFRGPRDEIKRRLEVYLPHVKAAKAGSKTKPVLDLGCGRGEWLELLRDRKLVARGVDLNASMVEVCTAGKLKVTHADAIEFLKAQRAKTFGAVTSFHLIEHLPFETLVELVRECWRVLRPGGLLIYETPNPENIRVGAHYFYRDYTHQRPLPPDSTQFLVQHIGFKKVDLLRLNPCAPQERVKDDGLEVAERFNDYFYSAQDYAVVAVK